MPADGSKTLLVLVENCLCCSMIFLTIVGGVNISVRYFYISSYVGIYKNLIQKNIAQ